jgi:hypothetical protein
LKLIEQLDVFLDGHSGLAQHGARLVECQREVAQLIGQLVSFRFGCVNRCPLAQKLLALGTSEDIHLDGVEQVLPLIISRRDQDIAWSRWNIAAKILWIVGIVENQQPAAVRNTASKGVQCGCHRTVDSAGHGRFQSEPSGQRG